MTFGQVLLLEVRQDEKEGQEAISRLIDFSFKGLFEAIEDYRELRLVEPTGPQLLQVAVITPPCHRSRGWPLISSSRRVLQARSPYALTSFVSLSADSFCCSRC